MLRPELPETPRRIAGLPVHRGFPVPWFVQWLHEDGSPAERGEGTPEFRLMDSSAISRAHLERLCWVCGGVRGSYGAFVAGAMCGINRTSAEPPSHVECATWSAEACPFLTRPGMRRREAGLPEEAEEPAGVMLKRNPGVAMVWVTKKYALKRAPNGGVLFDIGEPEYVLWFCEGRPATQAEIEESVSSGLPALRELAEQQGQLAVAQLDRMIKAFWKTVHHAPSAL